jgi:glycine oxidase
MLPPGNPECAPDGPAMLRAVSHRMWPKLSAQLRDETGIDNGFRQSGCIEVRLSGAADQLRDEMDIWRTEGVIVDELAPAAVAEIEPAVNRNVVAAYRLPEMAQVRNPRHLKALAAACASRGVEFVTGEPVIEFEQRENLATAVRTVRGVHRAAMFCIATGAWSRQLLARAGCDLPVEPVRGQIVLLSTPQRFLRNMVQTGSRYLVPRPDGRTLVGSTEEKVGFDKRTTAGGIGSLLALATELVPALGEATCERTWAGLRPGSVDGLPSLGRVPGSENVFVAAGHLRSGLQTSPATALVMRELMLGQKPSVPLDAFACDRHRTAERRSG